MIDRCLETTTVQRVIKEAAQRCDLRADQVASFSGHRKLADAAHELLNPGVRFRHYYARWPLEVGEFVGALTREDRAQCLDLTTRATLL